MARVFLTPVDLAQNELQNARVQNLGTAPTSPTPVKGQMYFNTGDNTLYWYNGTTWVAAKDAGATSVFYQTVRDDGTNRTQRNAINFVSTATVSLAVADDSGGDESEITADVIPGAITLNSLAAPTGSVSMGNQTITNLASPSNGTDAASKNYVDNLSAGLAWKDAVRAGSTANVNTASPGTTLDGVTLAANDRILLKDQSTGSQNGIWVWTASGSALTRATDADSEADLLAATVFVTEGTTNADKAYTMTTNAPITVGTTALVWVQFGAGTVYQAGNGLTLTGSTIDLVPANGSLTVGADDIQVAYAGTGSAVTAARSDHNHDTTYTRMAAANCAAATTTTITHNFNTRDVAVNVYRNSTPWDTVETDVERTDTNNVLVRFSVAPAAAAYRIVVYARS